MPSAICKVFPFLVLLAALACAGARAPVRTSAQATPSAPTSAASHAMGSKVTVAGVPNFGEVTPALYRGAQPTQEGMEALKKMGVDIVVNLRGGRNPNEEQAAAKLGMRYVSIPWQCYSPRDEVFARFLAVVRENPGKQIFVHCREGEDRTGMTIASYRMAEQGWSADEAMKEMQAFGFSATHHLTCPGLAGYEKKFPERWKTSAAFTELRAEAEKPK